MGGMDEILLRIRSIKKGTLSVFLGVSLLTAGALLFSLYRMDVFGKGFAFDYFSADSLYAKWETSSHEEMDPLEKLLSRRKELHAKFDAKIAQRLLSLGKAGMAESYVAGVLKRNADMAACFQKFSNISLAITKEEYAVALEHSRQLKEELAAKGSPVLRAYNLLRIALLEEKVGAFEAAYQAWEEVERGDQFASLAQMVHVEDLSLMDYIHYKKAQLKPSVFIDSLTGK